MNLELSHDVKILWSMLPPDCKSALLKIDRLGLKDQAKEWVIAEAEAGLKRCGDFRPINHCHALELAAKKWLEKEGLCS